MIGSALVHTWRLGSDAHLNSAQFLEDVLKTPKLTISPVVRIPFWRLHSCYHDDSFAVQYGRDHHMILEFEGTPPKNLIKGMIKQRAMEMINFIYKRYGLPETCSFPEQEKVQEEASSIPIPKRPAEAPIVITGSNKRVRFLIEPKAPSAEPPRKHKPKPLRVF